MSLALVDYLVIILFTLALLYLITQSLIKKQSVESYFRGGGKLHWAVIGMSLIAADLSIGYIIGSAGVGFEKGLAVGSYGWTACIVMIVMALYILPKFMRLQILTLPEYLELRYNKYVRLTVACIMLIMNTVGLSSMFYSSAILILKTFSLDHQYFYWMVWGAGILASSIILSGGLTNIFKADVLLSILVLMGGAVVVTFGLIKLGGLDQFILHSENKVKSVLPANDNFLPWTQVFFGSLWLMHLNYWAFNQTIIQKVLVSDSLSQAQQGILFAATVKIILPFLFVVPGIIGFELFGNSIEKTDYVFPMLLQTIIPEGLKGLVLVALSCSIIGVTNAILNSSSTIFTYDIYKRFINPDPEVNLIKVSRVSIAVIVVVSCLLAPILDNYEHIFTFSQMVRSIFVPAILGIFLFGLFSTRTPLMAAIVALGLCIPVFLTIKYLYPELSNTNKLGIGFLIIAMVMLAVRFIFPSAEPVLLTGKRDIRFERNLMVVIWSIFVVTMVGSVYLLFL